MDNESKIQESWSRQMTEESDGLAARIRISMDEFSRWECHLKTSLEAVNTPPSLMSCYANLNRERPKYMIEGQELEDLVSVIETREMDGNYHRNFTDKALLRMRELIVELHQDHKALNNIIGSSRPLPQDYRDVAEHFCEAWGDTIAAMSERLKALEKQNEMTPRDKIDFTKPQVDTLDPEITIDWQPFRSEGLVFNADDESTMNFFAHNIANRNLG